MDLKTEIEKFGLEEVAKIKEMIDKQEYPYEVEAILKMISKECVYPCDIINAYRFGVMQGQKIKNECGSTCGSE